MGVVGGRVHAALNGDDAARQGGPERRHNDGRPWELGRAVSSGCIRMLNTDVIDLYERVPARAPVVVVQDAERSMFTKFMKKNHYDFAL